MIGHAGPMPGHSCYRCGSVVCAGQDCEDGLDWEAQIVKPASRTFTRLSSSPDIGFYPAGSRPDHEDDPF